MIDINLLPAGARKQVSISSLSINIPAEITLGVGGTFVILLVLVNILLAVFCGVKSYQLAAKKSEWAKMQPARKTIDDINKESGDLRNMLGNITKGMLSKHVGWSRRLNVLSDSVVKGMWFKRLTFDGKSLLIEGYAVSKMQSDMTTVNTFLSNLRKDGGFMADVSAIDVNNVVKEKRGLVDVSKYSVTAKMK